MRIGVGTDRGVAPAISRALAARVVRETLKAEGLRAGDPWEVAVRFVGAAEIRELNRSWRRLDRVTDVLSFPAGEGRGGEYAGFLLGDIVASPAAIATQARRYRTSAERETAFVLVHGVLHLLGYDHDTPAHRRVMRRREGEIMLRIEELVGHAAA